MGVGEHNRGGACRKISEMFKYFCTSTYSIAVCLQKRFAFLILRIKKTKMRGVFPFHPPGEREKNSPIALWAMQPVAPRLYSSLKSLYGV